MKRLRCLLYCALAVLLLPVATRGQDDQYIRIYDLIQQGDTLNSANQPAQAQAKYLQAQTALQSFQRVYPGWNIKVVNFRLAYLEAKIAALTPQTPAAAAPTRKAAVAPVVAPVPSAGPSEADRRAGILQDQIRQLETEKASLEAKLKEAFAAQPTASDPQELAKVQEKVDSLIKENELLKVTLANRPAAADATAAPAALDELKKQFADANRKLEEQMARANNLQSEKQALQVQVDSLATLTNVSAEAGVAKLALVDVNQKLVDKSAQADKLAQERNALQTQLALLQSRLDQVNVQTNAQSEAAAAKLALNDANQKLADKSAQADKLAQERDALQARLGLLQGRLDQVASQTNVQAELVLAKQSVSDTNQKLADKSTQANKLAEERDALQLRNQDLQSQLSSIAFAQSNAVADLEATKKALASTNQQLADKSDQAERAGRERETLQERLTALMGSAAAIEALRAENEILKKQQGEAAKIASDQAAEQSRKLAAAETRLASLQAQVGVLNLEKTALQDRAKNERTVAPVPVAAKSMARPEDLLRIQQLEREREDLQKRLEVADRRYATALRPAKSVVVTEGNLAAQVANMRARLDVLEAQRIPFNAEELALFKQAQAKPTLVNAKPDAKPGAQPNGMFPEGTAALVADAQRYFAARRYDLAEGKYIEILRRDENNSYTLANLAAIQMELNHLDAAQKHIEQAISIAPEDGYNLSVLGYLRFRQKRYDEALDALSRAAKVNPKNPEIQNYLGVTLSQKGLRGPAETALRMALQIDPNYGDAHNNLAVIYATQKPPLMELARWHYQKALAAGQPHSSDLEKILKIK